MTQRDLKEKSLASFKDELFSRHPGIEKLYDDRQKAKAFIASIRDDLAVLRRHRNLKQSDLARSLGVSQPVISRVEGDKSADLGLETLYRYAEACGMKPVVTFVPNTEGVLAWGDETTDDRAQERQAFLRGQQAMLVNLSKVLHATVDKTMRTMSEDYLESAAAPGRIAASDRRG